MKNRCGKEDIYIIFEGPTEELFIKKLEKEFESKYNIVLINANGKDNIIKKYKSIKKRNNFSNVCVMYDLDGIDTISDILKKYQTNGIKIDKSDIYYINPQFELIFILCKKNRLPIDKFNFHIKNLYNIENYEKTHKQLEKIIKNITTAEILEMMNRLKKLKNTDEMLRATNYDKLFEKLFVINEKTK